MPAAPRPPKNRVLTIAVGAGVGILAGVLLAYFSVPR